MEIFWFFLLRLKRSFWLLPLLGCVLGIVLAAAAKQLDAPGGFDGDDVLPAFASIEAENARSLLATIAGAMATMLSLAYTLTLVVFTLAAGALAPRLLESFSDNRANQIAIAVLGGSFVYALVSLYLINSDTQPRYAAFGGILLAVISVGTLVYFVHDVAQRVLVDNEIARASERLRAAVELEFQADAPEPVEDPRPMGRRELEIFAERSGYIQTISRSSLISRAAEQDAFVALEVAPGDFIAEGSLIARLHGGRDAAMGEEDWPKAVNTALVLGPSRTSERDVLFCVHLLVEIALRALSPGVNDSFTAVRCIDQLSAALAKAAGMHPRQAIRTDDDGAPRLAAAQVTFEDLLDAAFKPICRDAERNLLAQAALRRAFDRLRAIAPEEKRPLIDRSAQGMSDQE